MKKTLLNFAIVFVAIFAFFSFTKNSLAQSLEITITKYNNSTFEEIQVNSANEAKDQIQKGYVTWIDVQNASQKEVVENFTKVFELPEVVGLDVFNSSAQPYIEEFDDYLFLVFKTFDSNSNIEQMRLEHISIIWAEDYIITFNENENENLTYVQDIIENRINKKSWSGYQLQTGYLAYIIMDSIVDSYFPALEIITEQLDIVEKDVLNEKDSDVLQKIYNIKREITKGRRAVWPMRNILNYLANYNYAQVSDELKEDLQNVYDNLNYLSEVAETLSQNNSEIVNFYISFASQNTNTILRFLTIVSTILFILSFVATIYGLNFSQFHPTEKRKKGHIFVIVAMSIMAIAMIAFFILINWI